ncbi:uncharacterized protein BJ212DRAFT_1352345 [Suillus subaureus]|uniref:Secreted protein n=1 Tax=Suillus subaureus TaxID=48587 RepID=A0A9P7EBX7_9AGAM|nr:uncharacterized protein BJ212DRAFT_1352345 [Suillus subaureus]KAG1816672.1 hypothetical protein BJ212DRAFT_1352345 [Suillus subaureus]
MSVYYVCCCLFLFFLVNSFRMSRTLEGAMYGCPCANESVSRSGTANPFSAPKRNEQHFGYPQRRGKSTPKPWW